MSSILDSLTSSLSGNAEQISGLLGTDPNGTAKAIQAAIPMLLGGLKQNAATPEGADALHRALDAHDGGLLDQAMDLFGGLQSADGSGILGHILGDRQGAAQAGIAKASGLDPAQVARILALVAPLVMAALGKAKQSQGLDPGGLSDLLGREHAHVEAQSPGLMGMLGQVLDRNHDGSMLDDALQMGGGLLGSLFGGQR
ncbi:MAG TPA: DUF937 domain-containing protein [Thermoanaerobaculia bacterium]|nr:DUF937 domain-containing protein [Thermoanaerobaculia bacterium]